MFPKYWHDTHATPKEIEEITTLLGPGKSLSGVMANKALGLCRQQMKEKFPSEDDQNAILLEVRDLAKAQLMEVDPNFEALLAAEEADGEEVGGGQ